MPRAGSGVPLEPRHPPETPEGFRPNLILHPQAKDLAKHSELRWLSESRCLSEFGCLLALDCLSAQHFVPGSPVRSVLWSH